MVQLSLLLSLASLLTLTTSSPLTSTTNPPITYGSVIKATHLQSSHHLLSSEINWGSGSGQQSVTATDDNSDRNALWVVNGREGVDRVTGENVLCGDVIRLTHLNTKKNLHSHGFRSPLSGQQEVSCFGTESTGDSSDNFELICDSSQKGASKNASSRPWNRNEPFRLKHAETGKYLSSSSGSKFTQANCPNCPIVGQLEVASTGKIGEGGRWVVQRGVFVSR